MISIIIPTFNEHNQGLLKQILGSLCLKKNVEIICVDSFSSDGTYELLQSFPVKTIQVNTNSRAQRLNIGIENSSYDLVLLHHPRSLIDPSALDYLAKNKDVLFWGGLTHQFDKDHYLLKFTSWYSNHVRAIVREIVYLDHCIFFNKKLLKDTPYLPVVDIFEDTLLSQKLKKAAPCTIIPYTSTTSSIRFNKNGIWAQGFLNQVLKLCFLLGLSDSFMNRIYERGIYLNSKYNS